jgi:hypothetical protein
MHDLFYVMKLKIGFLCVLQAGFMSIHARSRIFHFKACFYHAMPTKIARTSITLVVPIFDDKFVYVSSKCISLVTYKKYTSF